MLGDFPLPSTPGRQRGAGRGKGETVGQSAGAGRARFSSPERHTHTSDGKTLLPGVIGCLGVPLEPELGLGVDLVAVWPHGGEGLDRDILQEEGGQVSGPGHARAAAAAQWGCPGDERTGKAGRPTLTSPTPRRTGKAGRPALTSPTPCLRSFQDRKASVHISYAPSALLSSIRFNSAGAAPR